MSRRIATPHTGPPAVQLLGNARYGLMAASNGSSAARWLTLAVNRWRARQCGDAPACDILLRDLDTGAFWSASGQAFGTAPDGGYVEFDEGVVRYEQRCGDLSSTLEIAVAADFDGELRRVWLTNHGATARRIEVASVIELVLGSAAADASHPAFSKMFVQTEAIGAACTLLARRRPRSSDEKATWAAHTCSVEGANLEIAGFETNRMHLLGRGRSLRDPAFFDAGAPLDGSAGTVLDPVFCLRRQVILAPGRNVRITFWTVLGHARDALLAQVQHCRQSEPQLTLQAATDAARARLRMLGITAAQAARVQCLAAPVLYADPRWRAPADQLARGRGGPATLWPHAISGDRPIVLIQVKSISAVDLVREVLLAQCCWLEHQITADVVVLHSPALTDALTAMINEHGPPKDAGAAAFALRRDQIDAASAAGLATIARVFLDGDEGDLTAQLEARKVDTNIAFTSRVTPASGERASAPALAASDLEFFNGYGGFSANGREYVTVLDGRRCTPAPWINVIANAQFGFIAAVEGGGYTWSINSQQNQLTPWTNDAVSDSPTEAFYLRDVDTGALWCPTALPIRDHAPYTVAHGAGYTRYEHQAHDIATELVQFVAGEDALKISRLRLVNHSDRRRRLSVSAYVEWALGAPGSDSRLYVISSYDLATGALFARNPWRGQFTERVAFLDLGGCQQSYTGDRDEFIGARGSQGCPAALIVGTPLSGRVGAGLDPCAALQTNIELAPHAQTELVVMLGDATDEAEARELIWRYRAADLDVLLSESLQGWDELCDAVQVRTPERKIDLLLNRWLPYQVLACRVWARTGFYQCSGAWGFRDQLQDVMALCLSRPDIAREHLLRAASRQFVAGDVQHWWLPPDGAGVRTRIVDDRVWLPFATAHYVTVTGDAAILDERIAFLDGPALKPDQTESYFVPAAGAEWGSVFEHCARALEVSFMLGVHDLPLFGTGDWNDGMNRVGKDGKGESVWMAWFLIATIRAFAPLAEGRNEQARVQQWRAHAERLAAAAERHAWDGDWWTRGWYDDGSALGSASDLECRIDTIAQSWSVLSGAADRYRATRAMDAVDRMAVRRDAELIALFTPAFDVSFCDPGYIKGYPPGLRENGGQYTHGVIWSAIAFAELGDGDKAGELLAMLNPIHHADSADKIDIYEVEPYVSCADIYSAAGQVGRGGWTWYTGSGGWLYRAILEWQLGLRVAGNRMCVNPCIPRIWPGFEMVLRHGAARYEIAVENPLGVCRGVAAIEVDGLARSAPNEPIALVDDGATHRVRVRLG